MPEEQWKEEQQFARHRLGPDGKPLRLWPPPKREEFESMDDLLEYVDAISRYNNNLPSKPRPVPEVDASIGGPAPDPDGRSTNPEPAGAGSSTKGGVSRKVGIRLTPHDHRLLERLAAEHSVPPSTMARILVAKGVRAAYAPLGKSGRPRDD